MSGANLMEFRKFLPQHWLMSMAGAPAVYHCHHFNLFLDQSIEDALGHAASWDLRMQAARDAVTPMLTNACNALGCQTPAERVALAQTMFRAMGHGVLTLPDALAGTATGENLHYGFSWKEKYGGVVRQRHPVDAFAAGFAAAALETALGVPAGEITAKEAQCLAMRAQRCEFQFTRGRASMPLPPVGDEEVAQAVRPSFTGREEEQIEKIAAGLVGFTGGVAGDQRGLVQAFGVYVTMHLANYYNRISYDAVHLIQEKAPGSVGVLETLLRESGHVCVFNTFGGIINSPEWEGMVGRPTGDPLQIIAGCMAIGRALGFGRWCIREYVPGDLLVVDTPSTYESAYYVSRHGNATSPNEYFLQGAVLAISQLAHRLDWRTSPRLDADTYKGLFQNGSLPWKVEQELSIACGAPRSRVSAVRIR